MIYKLNDTLNFGRYRGWSVSEIISGWKTPTQAFVYDYIKYCFSQPFRFGDCLPLGVKHEKLYSLTVLSFDLLINNEIRIDWSCDSEKPIYLIEKLNWMLESSESYPHKEFTGSANDFILKEVENGKPYKIFADPAYIAWALEKHDMFFLNQEALTLLDNVECNFFYGVKLTQENEKDSNIFSYEVEFRTRKYSINYSSEAYKNKLKQLT